MKRIEISFIFVSANIGIPAKVGRSQDWPLYGYDE